MAPGKTAASALLLATLTAPLLVVPAAMSVGEDLFNCIPESFPCCVVPGPACHYPDPVACTLELGEPGSLPCGLDEAPGEVDSLAETLTAFANAVAHEGSKAVPRDDGSLLLFGQGQATVKVNGREASCHGPSTFVLEVSRKPLGLEPTGTMAYFGSSQEGGFLLPCARGEIRQPVIGDVQGDFAGAWRADRHQGNFHWHLIVGAPVDGQRHVHYWYEHENGSQGGSFQGTVAEYR